MRIAPFVPRMVLMKNCSNPLVVACVTMKSPTPRTMHERLMIIDRFFAVRKRNAMAKFGDIPGTKIEGGGPQLGFRRSLNHDLDAIALSERVELIDDHEVAFLQPRQNLDVIEAGE